MANNLTGDYEAVVQIAVRSINGLLATLHQNGAQDDPPIKLLHSVSMRIGDPRRPRPDLAGFSDWVLDLQQAGPKRPIRDLRAELTGKAPPGAAKRLAEHFDSFDTVLTEDPPVAARGTAKIQLSAIRLGVADGVSSEVTVLADVRARYYPDANTAALPEPVHGEVRVAFDVRKAPSPAGTRLFVTPSPVDSKIQFIAAPGSGLDPVEASRLAAEVRRAVRNDFELRPVDLPAGFPFAEFTGLGGGATQAIALPISLSGAPVPPNRLQTITQQFVGPSGFGFAVSKEHVLSLIDLDAIRQSITQREIRLRLTGPFGIGSTTVTYRLRFSQGPALTFKTGAIEISGRVEAETPTWWAPNITVSFTQDITLVLDTATQRVSLEAVGEPDVSAEWPFSDARASSIVSREVNTAISANNPTVRRVFGDARSSLVSGLRTFDTSATASYTGVQISPDGVVVRGDIGGAGRIAPVIHVAETHQRQAFTAFQSWIPGGTIHRFIWSWVELRHPFATPWGGIVKTAVDDHRFILPKPQGIGEVSQICLKIEGTQTLASGQIVNVSGGTMCQVQEPEIVMDVPSWWEPVHVPVWAGDVDAGALVRDAIVGHVTVQSDRPRGDRLTANSLVYFADWQADRPLAAIADALTHLRSTSHALVIYVVLPPGTFDCRRRELEARLAPLGEHRSIRLQLAEDDEGGWSRTFGRTRTPSVYLINARREFVWHDDGEPDSRRLAAALDEHLVPAPGPRFRPVQLALSPGHRAPDARFADLDGSPFALHRMRGRPMLINFFQAWSAPSLRELERLQAITASPRRAAPFIVAFHGGRDARSLDEIRKRYGLTFPIVQDVEQQVARQYGVRCWPTTVSVNEAGVIDQVQFGAAHGHDARPADSVA
jgi:peroxiredoxin